MIFPMRDPWIDPRYKLVSTAQAESYLIRHGWRQVDYPQPEVQVFEGPLTDSGRPIRQYVPRFERAEDFHRCILDIITNVARLEDRYAVDVLNEMLGITTPSGNGAPNAKPIAESTPAPVA